MSEWLVFDPDTGVLTAFSLPVWAAALLVCVPLVVAALIVFAVLWRRRRRAAKAEAEAEVDTAPETLVGPVESYTVGKLHGQGAREYQQDCFGVSDEALLPTHGLLAVVADGMGGLSDGDRVSVAAVQTALDAFTRVGVPLFFMLSGWLIENMGYRTMYWVGISITLASTVVFCLVRKWILPGMIKTDRKGA